MTLGVKKRIVGLAHDVLPQCVKAVHVVFEGPCEWETGFEGHEMLTEDFLLRISGNIM